MRAKKEITKFLGGGSRVRCDDISDRIAVCQLLMDAGYYPPEPCGEKYDRYNAESYCACYADRFFHPCLWGSDDQWELCLYNNIITVDGGNVYSVAEFFTFMGYEPASAVAPQDISDLL